MLDLLLLDANGAAASALQRAAGARGQRTLARVVERSPYVDTTGSPDDWRAGVDHHLLTELRRRRRRLEERGMVSLAVERGDGDLDGLLAEGLAIEAAGWKGTRGTAIRAGADTLRFYTHVARWAAARGWLRLAFLRVDGVGVAFDFALQQDGVHWLLKTGYDPAWRTCSPGKLLRLEMISAAFDAGLRSYEFLGNDEAWKLEWNVRLRERLRLQVFGRTPAGRTLWWAYTQGRPLLHRARRLGAAATPHTA
jgi:CelD/BcsL family acetyltransferase involved in cellulose biosynthesis